VAVFIAVIDLLFSIY